MKKVMFIGQAPARPSSHHEIPGIYLHQWLNRVGVDETAIAESCLFYALTDTFPGSAENGGHAIPSKEAIDTHLPILRKAIREEKPDIVVPVGQMSIRYITGTNEQLVKIIGKAYSIDPLESLGYAIPCIPLPHPSGRSVWNVTHKELVSQALDLLKSKLNHPGETL